MALLFAGPVALAGCEELLPVADVVEPFLAPQALDSLRACAERRRREDEPRVALDVVVLAARDPALAERLAARAARRPTAAVRRLWRDPRVDLVVSHTLSVSAADPVRFAADGSLVSSISATRIASDGPPTYRAEPPRSVPVVEVDLTIQATPIDAGRILVDLELEVTDRRPLALHEVRREHASELWVEAGAFRRVDVPDLVVLVRPVLPRG